MDESTMLTVKDTWYVRVGSDVGHIQVGVQGATIVADPQMLEFWREAEHELLRDEPVECLFLYRWSR